MASRSRSRRLLLLLPVALGALVAGVLAFRGDDPAEALRRQVTACRTNDCVVEVLLEGMSRLGPQGVLTAYAVTAPNSGFDIDCHDATHRLGEEAWARFGLAGWVPGGGVCNFGYYHGFMVGASAAASAEEFTDVAHRLCELEPLPSEYLPGPECVHGFGHAVFHISGSLTDAVGRCAGFTDDSFRRRCNEGAVKDSLMFKPDVTDEDFARCLTLPPAYRGTCVYVTAAYAVVRVPAVADAAVLCAARTEGELRVECLEGLGRGVSMRAVGERFRTPGVWAATVCGLSEERAFGFDRSSFFIRNDPAWSRAECAQLAPAVRDRCVDGVADADASR